MRWQKLSNSLNDSFAWSGKNYLIHSKQSRIVEFHILKFIAVEKISEQISRRINIAKHATRGKQESKMQFSVKQLIYVRLLEVRNFSRHKIYKRDENFSLLTDRPSRGKLCVW